MDGPTLATFLLLCLVNTVVPGPNLLLALRTRASGGRRAARDAVTGIAAAQLLWGLLAVGGIAAVFEAAPLLFVAMKLIGALYIGTIGLGLALRGIGGLRRDRSRSAAGRGARFAEGLVTCLLNPNVLLFYLAILPQFLTVAGTPAIEAATLVVLYVTINVSWLLGATHAFGRLGARGLGSGARRWAGRGLGVGMVGFGALLVARL